MVKFCVFCGEGPVRKTGEHILPGWLLKMTGEPSRIGHFGLVRSKNIPLKEFKFPACQACNENFGKLEEKAKEIIQKVLAKNLLSAIDFHILLDWMDKVRVGSWLGLFYLEENPGGINPHYHISTRLGLFDRLLLISRSNLSIKLLSLIGPGFPSFTYTPSCFTLIINNTYFFNASTHHLFSRRLGFPFAKETYMLMNEEKERDYLEMHIERGIGRMMEPLIRKPFRVKGTQIYQPLFSYQKLFGLDPKPFSVPYVKRNSLNWEYGIGKVYHQVGGKVFEYPRTPCDAWLPFEYNDPVELDTFMKIQTLEFLNYIEDISPSLIKLTPKWQSKIKRIKKSNVSFNNFLIRRLLSEWRKRQLETKEERII
jgi:hypothetical protein